MNGLDATAQVVNPGGPSEFEASIDAQRTKIAKIARALGTKPCSRQERGSARIWSGGTSDRRGKVCPPASRPTLIDSAAWTARALEIAELDRDWRHDADEVRHAKALPSIRAKAPCSKTSIMTTKMTIQASTCVMLNCPNQKKNM